MTTALGGKPAPIPLHFTAKEALRRLDAEEDSLVIVEDNGTLRSIISRAELLRLPADALLAAWSRDSGESTEPSEKRVQAHVRASRLVNEGQGTAQRDDAQASS